PGIETLLGTKRIDNHSLTISLLIQVDLIPVTTPLPDVAGHVVESIAVGRKRLHGRSTLITVPSGVLPRELTLPAVALRSFVENGSSPQTYVFPSKPPRAANSHSASVGNRLPAHFA